MTVINPNSVAGINSITVQSGNSLSVHKSDGTLIRTLTESSGISTFTSVSVGSATTDNNANTSINVGLGASISQHAVNSLSFGTGGDERARLDSSGNLIIGSTSANAKLHLASGSNTAVGDATNPALQVGGTTNYRLAAYTSNEQGIIANKNGDDGIAFHTKTGTAAGAFGEAVRITSVGDVGIGTDTMNAPLTVVNNDNAGYIASFRQKHSSNSAQIIIDSPSDSNVRPTSIDLAQAGTVKWSLGQAYASQSSQAFHIATSSLSVNDNNAKLTVSTDGDVGIGTQVPSFRLHISDSSPGLCINREVDSVNQLNFRTMGTQRGSIGASSGSCLQVHDSSSIEKFRIKQTGEVGIGSNAPTHNLDVFSSSNTYIKILRAGYDPFYIGNAAGEGVLEATNDIFIKSGGSERARITGVGSFGVGTGGDSVESMIHIDKTSSTTYDATATDAQRGGTATLNITNDDTTNDSFAQIAFRNDGSNQSVARIVAIKRSTNSSHLAFVTEHGGTPQESMRINSDGFIGVGGESPATNPRGQFVINSNKDANTNATNPADPHHYHLCLKNNNDTNSEAIGLCFSASSTVDRVGAAIIHQRTGAGSVGHMKFFTSPSEGNTTQRFQIDKDGNKFMDSTFDTTANNERKSYFTSTGQLQMGRNAHEHYIVFQDVSNNQIGGIVRGASSQVAYNTTSDHRLKENVVDLTDAITRLKTLSPRRFNFIAEPSITVDGFIAHEVTAVPEAVEGEKDAVVTQAMIDSQEVELKSVGDPIYQGIDQSKLVPLLTAALQEAITKIETLETKVAALEGG